MQSRRQHVKVRQRCSSVWDRRWLLVLRRSRSRRRRRKRRRRKRRRRSIVTRSSRLFTPTFSHTDSGGWCPALFQSITSTKEEKKELRGKTPSSFYSSSSSSLLFAELFQELLILYICSSLPRPFFSTKILLREGNERYIPLLLLLFLTSLPKAVTST